MKKNVHASVCVCVCLCVCEWEREREREKQCVLVCVCVWECVCVCVGVAVIIHYIQKCMIMPKFLYRIIYDVKTFYRREQWGKGVKIDLFRFCSSLIKLPLRSIRSIDNFFFLRATTSLFLQYRDHLWA